MQPQRYYYLCKVQFLGYRLHGWQRQPNLKTVEGLLKKTFKFIIPERKFKILGSSRTDAMVSANCGAFELFLEKIPLDDIPSFLKLLNKNLPQDIRVLEITEVDASFNIINSPKTKEYLYLFSFGEKSHPFAAPFMANFQDELDIDLMKKGALLFKGVHNFKNYCVKSKGKNRYEREILAAQLSENTYFTASFFPKKSYVFRVEGSGFLRYQVRLMMGGLIMLGKGEMSLEDIEESLKAERDSPITYIAPASGLILNDIEFE